MARDFSPNEPDWGPIYEDTSQKTGVPVDVLRSIVYQESSGKWDSIGPPTPWGRALGGGQFLPGTARSLGVTDPFDPRQFIPAIGKYLREGLDKYNWDFPTAFKYYHGGPNQQLWGERTRNYSSAVSGRYTQMGGQMANLPKGPPLPPDPLALKPEDYGGDTADRAPTPAGQNAMPPDPMAPPDFPPKEAPITAEDAARSKTQELAAKWGPGYDFTNAALMGQGTKLAAAEGASADYFHNNPDKKSWKQLYQEKYQELDAQRRAWGHENPGPALGNNIIGPIAATTGIVGGATKLAGVGAEMLGIPAGVQRFFSGAAGAGESGVKGLATRTASGLANTAVTAPLTIAAQSGMSDESLTQQFEHGLPIMLAADPLLRGASNKIFGLPNMRVDPKTAEAALAARNMGIDIPTVSIAESPTVRAIGHTVIPPGSGPELNQQYTRAVGKTFGADTSRLTLPEYQAASQRIDSTYQNVVPKMGFDPAVDVKQAKAMGVKSVAEDLKAFRTGLDNVEEGPGKNLAIKAADEVERLLLNKGSSYAAIPTGAVAGTGAAPRSGGDVFLDLAGYKSKIYNLKNSQDPYSRQLGTDLYRILDDGLERNAIASGNTEALDAFRTVRRQKANLELFENAVAQAQPTGMLSPPNVTSAINRKYGAGGSKGIPEDLAPLVALGSGGKTGAMVPSADTFGSTEKKKNIYDLGRSLVEPVLLGSSLLGAGSSMFGVHPILAAATALSTAGAAASSMGLRRKFLSDQFNRSVLERNIVDDMGNKLRVPFRPPNIIDPALNATIQDHSDRKDLPVFPGAQ